MKKIIYIISLFAALFIFAGCNKTVTEKDSKMSIIATTFPEYDWLVNVLGDEISGVDVTFLMKSGSDLHNYQPTVTDIAKIADCDLFIFNGGESDEWVENALETTDSKAVVVSIMERLEDYVKLEEVVEGMEPEGEDYEEEYDEHVWLSLKNRQVATMAIRDALSKLMPEKAEIFAQNAEKYCSELARLDAEYSDTIAKSNKDTLIFGDRFPFRYMLDDYGIKYYAAFPGCSTESNASFETVVFLSERADEIMTSYIITTEGSDCKIANSIIDNTTRKSAQVLALNSMQAGTSQNDKYIEIMRANLKVLEKALG